LVADEAAVVQVADHSLCEDCHHDY
jgi:hypothetical protein